jgi:hypothetical protein
MVTAVSASTLPALRTPEEEIEAGPELTLHVGVTVE